MLILACDTSSSSCSAGLYEDGRVIAQTLLSLGKTHSLTFMPLVHDLMIQSGRTYKDLDAFACAVGPGSFTGIRIGVSAVKAMAMVAAKPAIAVSSLAALAFPFSHAQKALVVAMTDARNRRVFSSAYCAGVQVIPEKARTIEEMISLCEAWENENGHSQYILCGDAAETYACEEFFRKRQAHVPVLFGREVQPGSVAALASGIADESLKSQPGKSLFEIFPPQGLMPVYRAKTSAERLFQSKKEDVHD